MTRRTPPDVARRAFLAAGVAGLVGQTLVQSTGFNSQHQETGTTYTADLSDVFT